MSCKGFWFLIIMLMLVLAKCVHGQAPDSQQCENCCTYLGSKIIRLNFYDDEKDFEDARRTCQRRNSTSLLTEEMYDHMNVCIHKYLENKTSATIWLDGKAHKDNLEMFPTFSLKGKNYTNKDNWKHRLVCVSQDKTYKAFNLTVEDVTGHKLTELDLLSPPWTEGEVFRNVSVGQTLTLLCEAEGIPHPQMIFRKDGVEMRHVTRINTSLSIKLSVDQCGNLGIFTCENNISSLNRSIVITVPCGDTEPPGVEYSQDHIKCFPDRRSYTDVKIVKQFDNKQLPTVKDNDTFITRINRRCNVMETYACVVSLKDGTTTNSTINVGFENCSLQLCPGEANNQTVYTTIGRKSIFSFCVIAYPNISNFLLFNNSVVYKNNETNFNWDYTQNSFPASYNVTISINNVTSYGKFTVGVFTSQDKDYNLNYTIQIIQTLEDKAGSNLGTDHATTATPGVDTSAVIIPVVVITVAVVMAFCCLICVGCGVLLYKKRGKLIRSLSKSLHVEGGSLYNNSSKTDSVELRSSVSVYANMKHGSRKSLEKDLTESRAASESGRAYTCNRQDNDQELYSTVNTVNVYTNLRSILQSKSSSELEKLYEETSLMDNHYGNLGHSDCDPYVSNPSSGARYSSGGEQESGRYISDGLLYITVEHAGNGKSFRPVKAKSEEKVDYVKLDFDKTGKLYRKKHKHSKTRKTTGK